MTRKDNERALRAWLKKQERDEQSKQAKGQAKEVRKKPPMGLDGV